VTGTAIDTDMDGALATNLADLQRAARRLLDRPIYNFVAGGAGDERTRADNRRAFRRIRFVPRVLRDVRKIDLAVDVLGQPLAMPVLLAPTAFNALVHPDGEVAAARAACKAGTTMVVSTMASCVLEEIAANAGGTLWFQLYLLRDRGLTRELVQRAEAARCGALMITADVPRLGSRERDARHRFLMPAHVAARNLAAAGCTARWDETSSFSEFNRQLLDPGPTWDTIEWIRAITRLPVILKGILAADDAERAVSAGASAVVVSNHGGRQLDGAMASIERCRRWPNA
jgi:4-hydroxymandelate oxidase